MSKPIHIISFTDAGHTLGESLKNLLLYQAVYQNVPVTNTRIKSNIRAFVAEIWPDSQGLIFIGAAAIAVRSIAPLLQDKTKDPAVLVIDEKGKFVISLLSGHLGGANAMATLISGLLQAQAVITTATDVNQVFAVDTWAKAQGLHIVNSSGIKPVSANLLKGKTVGLYSTYPLLGSLPKGIIHETSVVPPQESKFNAHIYIGPRALPRAHHSILELLPQNLFLGVGCRRGKSREDLQEALNTFFSQYNLSTQRLCQIASVDLKKDEAGLLDLAADLGVDILFFSAADLALVQGDFPPSDFVKDVAGVDNVCQRSAFLAAANFSPKKTLTGESAEANPSFQQKTFFTGPVRLLIPKTVFSGITFALYEKEYIGHF